MQNSEPPKAAESDVSLDIVSVHGIHMCIQTFMYINVYKFCVRIIMDSVVCL